MVPLQDGTTRGRCLLQPVGAIRRVFTLSRVIPPGPWRRGGHRSVTACRAPAPVKLLRADAVRPRAREPAVARPPRAFGRPTEDGFSPYFGICTACLPSAGMCW